MLIILLVSRSFFPILVYVVFGTSPHVSMGTNPVISLLTAGLVERKAAAYTASLPPNVTVSQQEILVYKVFCMFASQTPSVIRQSGIIILRN
jgi:MFS superfamily sulfate permease-like transporter